MPLLRRYDSKTILIARIVGKVSPYLYVLELFDTSGGEDIRLLDVAKGLAGQLMGPEILPAKVRTQASPPQSCVLPAAKISLMTSRQLLVTTTVDAQSFIGQLYPADQLNDMQVSEIWTCFSFLLMPAATCKQFLTFLMFSLVQLFHGCKLFKILESDVIACIICTRNIALQLYGCNMF